MILNAKRKRELLNAACIGLGYRPSEIPVDQYAKARKCVMRGIRLFRSLGTTFQSRWLGLVDRVVECAFHEVAATASRRADWRWAPIESQL